MYIRMIFVFALLAFATVTFSCSEVMADSIKGIGLDAYYRVVANNIWQKVDAEPKEAQPKALLHEWEYVGAIDLPPASKALLAKQLNNENANSKQMLPILAGYLEAEPQDIMNAQI